MEILNLLGNCKLNKKNKVDRVLPTDINAILDYLDEMGRIVRNYQKDFCNVNLEAGYPNHTYSFSDAVNSIPSSRRSNGFVIKFKNKEGNWEQWVYTLTSISVSDWMNPNNWVCINKSDSLDAIDGGIITAEHI